MADFKQFLTSQNIPWTDKDLNGVMDWLKVNIKAIDHYQPVRPVAGTARDGRLGSDDPEGADLPARGTGA